MDSTIIQRKKPSFCEPCVDGKQCRMPFPKTGGERSEELLGVVHSDVCGKMKRSHSAEQNILLPSSMTNQDLSGYTH